MLRYSLLNLDKLQKGDEFMFLHIGQEVSILVKNIIAIIDYDTTGFSASTEEFLEIANDEGFVVSLTDKPNSFIITMDKVYLSPISSITLYKRTKEFFK